MTDQRPDICHLARSAIAYALAAFQRMPGLFAVLFSVLAMTRLLPTGRDFGYMVAGVSFLVEFALTSFALTVLAVVVHRFIIQKKICSLRDLATIRISIFEFFAVNLIVKGLFYLYSLTIIGYIFVSPLSVKASIILILPVMIFIFIFAARFFLIFPAIAVEAKGRSVRAALRDGRGLALTMICSGTLCVVPLMITRKTVVSALGGDMSPTGAIVATAYDMLAATMIAAVASQLYVWEKQRTSWRRLIGD